jgi:signal transduction histidine kinase
MLKENYTRAKINEAKNTAEKIIDIIKESGFNDDAFTQISELTSVSKESVAILNEKGDSYFSSLFFDDRFNRNSEYGLDTKSPMELQENITSNKLPLNVYDQFFSLVFEAASKFEEFLIRGDNLQNHKLSSSLKIIVYGNVFTTNEKKYSIMVASPLDPINEVSNLITRQLIYIAGIALIAGSLLALLLSKSFTKKIVTIKNVSSEIAKGNFNEKVMFKSKDEFQELASSINEMSYQLSKLEVFRREFISNTSHDLKTPLSSISVYAELIRDIKLENEEKLKEYSNVIMDEIKRLNSRISEISELSELEAGYYKLKLEKIELKEFVENTFKEINILSEKKRIIFENKVPENIYIVADKKQFYKALINIFSNSIKYTDKDGVIKIYVDKKERRIRVYIQDNGCGICEEDLKYVWDRFYKVNRARNEDDYSSGLGMSIIKNIFIIHGFKYGIESKENEGTIIWFEYSIKN